MADRNGTDRPPLREVGASQYPTAALRASNGVWGRGPSGEQGQSPSGVVQVSGSASVRR